MSGLDSTPTPALCRLCRRPIPRAVTKCPYCRAQLLWNVERRRPGGLARRARDLKRAGIAAAIVVGIVLAVAWLWVLREVKAPAVSSTDPTTTATRPASADCASLIGVLTGGSGSESRITPELRDKFRQCFQRR